MLQFWDKGRMSRLNPRRFKRLVCVRGALWATRTGFFEDQILTDGDFLIVQGGGWVIEALKGSWVDTEDSAFATLSSGLHKGWVAAQRGEGLA